MLAAVQHVPERVQPISFARRFVPAEAIDPRKAHRQPRLVALARVHAEAEPLPAEMAPLAAAHGRLLSADVAALRTQPPPDVSAMDR